jgi:Cas7 group CRISPR-associated protein Csh2
MIRNDLIARQFPAICDPTTAKYARVTMLARNANANMGPDIGSVRQDAQDFALMSVPSINRKVRDYLSDHGQKIYFMRDIEAVLEQNGGGHQLKDWAFFNGVHDSTSALATFTDIRLMGAVITLKPASKNDAATQPAPGDPKNGQVLGSMQVGMAVSSDPVIPTEMTVVRMTSDESHTDRTMGTRVYVEGDVTYKFPVRYCAHIGQKNGVSVNDLAAYWTALINGFEWRTSQKGQLICTELKVACFDTPEGAFDPDNPPKVITVTNFGPAAGLDEWIDAA